MLTDKIILVTGASSGIGRAVAKQLAALGATVILLGRTIKDLEAIYDEICAQGYPTPNIYPFNLCAATPTDFDDLRRNILKLYGRLDGLIHNAGFLGSLTPLEHYNFQTWYQVLQVNLNGPFMLTQACLPLLKQSANGSIIFTIPPQAITPKANWGAYAVAGAGCNALMQMLSSECENLTNIRVNAIQPSLINTPMHNQAYPGHKPTSLWEPAEITQIYADLMSDTHINTKGQTFMVGGIKYVCSESEEYSR